MEILWTGLNSFLKKDYKLQANTSLWMFPIYGMCVFLEPVCDLISPLPFMIRGGVYVILIFAVEFITGFGLMKTAGCPWDYSSARFNFKGLIRFDYAPLWFAAGLLYENFYRLLVSFKF